MIDQYQAKQKIIERFENNVLNQTPPKNNSKHSGHGGHWLEKKLGKKPDGDNKADFWGYECKNFTTSKTTWGDWTANYYIFNDKKLSLTRDEFIKIFGKFNNQKNRFSWSGSHVPGRHGDLTEFGQSLVVKSNKDIAIYYNYSKDKRGNKKKVIPSKFKKNDLLLAKWYGLEKNNTSRKTALETKINNKFNQLGWFKCIVENGKYTKIVFGDPIDITQWIDLVIKGDIFFDSGMYFGNNRPYSVWRSDNSFWNSLIKEEYPEVK